MLVMDVHAPETITIGLPEKKVIFGSLNSSAELLSGYVENGFCTGWVLSRMGSVRDGLCPEWVIFGKGFVRTPLNRNIYVCILLFHQL